MAEMDERFRSAVESVSTPTYMTSKAELVEYYKDQYGQRGWKQKIVRDLAAMTGMKPKNLERRFDPSRLQNVEKRNAAQYKALGQQQPPIDRKPNKDTITVTVKGDQRDKRRGTRQRTITVTLKGSQAYDWVNDPDFDVIWDEYGFDFDEAEDGDYALENITVSAS